MSEAGTERPIETETDAVSGRVKLALFAAAVATLGALLAAAVERKLL